jgi:hypothetical protein
MLSPPGGYGDRMFNKAYTENSFSIQAVVGRKRVATRANSVYSSFVIYGQH